MDTVRKMLLALFVLPVAGAIGMVCLFESMVLEPGAYAAHHTSEFLWLTVMEMTTLAAAWLALRLFRFRRVRNDLATRRERALLRWGSIRILLLNGPLLLDTLLYYIYMQTTFGYMAIILAICLAFVYPSASRCRYELNPEDPS